MRWRRNASASVSDSPTVPTGVVLYRVIATQGVNSSPASNIDVACTKSFTDDPILIASPFTLVKAKHLVEIRQAVNALRELAGASAIYAGNDLNETYIRTLFIDDFDFTTLMTNLNAARAAAGLPSTSFLITPAAGAFIRNTQMSNLRAGIK